MPVQGVLAVLVGLSVVGGLVLLTDAFRVGSTSLVWVLVTVLAIVVGVAVALRGGFDRDPAEVLVPRLIPHADRGLGVDALYVRLVADPVLWLARLVAFVDTEVIDAYVRGTAVATRAAGWAGGRAFRGERAELRRRPRRRGRRGARPRGGAGVVVSLLLLVPAVVGLFLVTGGRTLAVEPARLTAAGAAALTLVLAVAVCIARPGVDLAWLPELGVRWSFGVDGIAVPLVLLTSLIGVLVAAHAWVDVPAGGTPATFLGCLLIVEAGALATFTARDAVLFFVAFELVLVPMWVLISRFGDPHDERARTDAGHRFILYTAVGSTLMLVGILALVTSAGTSDLRALATGAGAALPASRQLLVAVLLVLGLSVKVPVFPLHTWLPPAHTTAPTAGSVLLAAVLLKMGTYGLVRLPVATVPDGFARIAPVLAWSASSASSGAPWSAWSSAT